MVKRNPFKEPDWNHDDDAWQEASALIDEAVANAKKAITRARNDKTVQFLESVATRLRDFRVTIRTNRRVSEKQLTAITNMKAGIDKCLGDQPAD
jgi:hypothetical protein